MSNSHGDRASAGSQNGACQPHCSFFYTKMSLNLRYFNIEGSDAFSNKPNLIFYYIDYMDAGIQTENLFLSLINDLEHYYYRLILLLFDIFELDEHDSIVIVVIKMKQKEKNLFTMLISVPQSASNQTDKQHYLPKNWHQ